MAFPTDAERYEIEHFAQQNRFFASDGTRDPEMRQRRRDGSGFVRVSTAAEPASATLRRLCGFFSAELLAELNSVLLTMKGPVDEA